MESPANLTAASLLFPGEINDMHSWIHWAGNHLADRPAIRYYVRARTLGQRDTYFSYRQLSDESIKTANLLNGLQLEDNDPVVTYLPDRPEHWFAALGSMCVGKWLPVNALRDSHLVSQLLLQDNIKVLITLGAGRGYNHWNEVEAIRGQLPNLRYIFTVFPDHFGPVIKESMLWRWFFRRPIQLAPSQAVWDFHQGIHRYQNVRLDSRKEMLPSRQAIEIPDWGTDTGEAPMVSTHIGTIESAISLMEAFKPQEPPIIWTEPEAFGYPQSILATLACWFSGGELYCGSQWEEFEIMLKDNKREVWIVCESQTLELPRSRRLPVIPGAKVLTTGKPLSAAAQQDLTDQFGWKFISSKGFL